MKIHHKIRKARELKGLSEQDMADSLRISLHQYRRLEGEDTALSYPDLEKIAHTFGLPLFDLLSGKLQALTEKCHDDSDDSTVALTNEIERLRLLLAHKDTFLSQQKHELTTAYSLLNQPPSAPVADKAPEIAQNGKNTPMQAPPPPKNLTRFNGGFRCH